MSKPHRTTGKRTPFDTPGIQIRNPLAMGTIEVVSSDERSVEQTTKMDDHPMPGFNVKAFTDVYKEKIINKSRTNKKTVKKIVSLEVKKKPLWYRVIQKVASVLLLLFPKDKLDESKYKKNERKRT